MKHTRRCWSDHNLDIETKRFLFTDIFTHFFCHAKETLHLHPVGMDLLLWLTLFVQAWNGTARRTSAQSIPKHVTRMEKRIISTMQRSSVTAATQSAKHKEKIHHHQLRGGGGAIENLTVHTPPCIREPTKERTRFIC